jgi:hypothetical protein
MRDPARSVGFWPFLFSLIPQSRSRHSLPLVRDDIVKAASHQDQVESR